MSPGIDINLRGVKKLLARLDGIPKRLGTEWRKAARDLGAEHERRVKTNQFGPFQANSFANKLRVRTGATRAGIRFTLTGAGRSTVMRSRASGRHVRLQEFGGVVRAKSKLLKIPLPSALTPSGNLKSSAVFGSDKTNSKGQRSFVFKSKAGNLIIAITTGKRKKLVPLFVLKKQVRIPPGRLGFFRTWREMREFRRKRLGLFLSRTLGRSVS